MKLNMRTTIHIDEEVEIKFPIHIHNQDEYSDQYTRRNASGCEVKLTLCDIDEEGFDLRIDEHRLPQHQFRSVDSKEYNLGLNEYACTEVEFKLALAQGLKRLLKAAHKSGMDYEELLSLAQREQFKETIQPMVKVYRCERCGVEGPDVALVGKYSYRMCPRCAGGSDVNS